MEAAANIPADVIIIHTNDIHSRLENAARIASYIDLERGAYGSDRVLVLDMGDHMDRMRPETEGSDGLVNVELMNAAGYDAATLGNNEGLTYTPEIIGRTYRDHAAFAVLCANMEETDGGRPDWLLAHAVVRKGGLSIGLIAVTASFTEFYSLIGWTLTDPIEAVRREVEALRVRVDLIAVMSHLGLPLDRKMAESVPGIDLIMGGHTHHLLEEPLVVGDTTICAAGKFGEHIGRVEVRRGPAGSRPIIRAACLPSGAWERHPVAADIIARFRESGAHRLSAVVARLAAPLPADAERESPLANLLAAGLRRWTGAEIGLVNAGQLLAGLPQGDVTRGQLHALCPSPINPCRIRLSGADIREALEQSLLPAYIGKPIKGFGFRGEVLGTLAVDGMRIAYDPEGRELRRIARITVGGEPLEPDRIYEVGTIDMFTFKIGYESLARSETRVYYLPEFIRDVLACELQNAEAIEECRKSRWKLL